MSFNIPVFPVRASTFADQYDFLFYLILALAVFFTVVVMFFAVFFAVRYRHGAKVNRSHPPHESLTLEITWSVIPLILGLCIFGMGAKQFIDFVSPPKKGLEVYCIGKQWMWHFEHAENGIRENNELHVPVGVPVTVTMISQDVIHALYLPEFRFQYQVVPGRYTQAWFQATRPGVYHLFCNMYCGTQHSEMGGYVYVMSQRDYANWCANGGNDPQPMTLAQRGHLVYNRLSCSNCHQEQTTERAPSLYGMFGKSVQYNDGSTAVIDTARLREAILNPYDHVVKGYGNTMPVYKGDITEEDLLPLMAYIESLGIPPTQSQTAADNPELGYNGGTSPNTPPRLDTGALEAQKGNKPAPSHGNEAVNALAAQERHMDSQSQVQISKN